MKRQAPCPGAGLRPLPGTAVALLAGLGAVWAGLLLYVLYEFVRRKKG